MKLKQVWAARRSLSDVAARRAHKGEPTAYVSLGHKAPALAIARAVTPFTKGDVAADDWEICEAFSHDCHAIREADLAAGVPEDQAHPVDPWCELHGQVVRLVPRGG